MSVIKRVLLGGLPIGLVITVLLAHNPLQVVTPSVHATKAVAPVVLDVPNADLGIEFQIDQDAVAKAEADAIAQLAAEQAQALADQLAAAAQRSLQAIPPVQTAPQASQVASPPPSSDCYSVNPYAAYIYQHESGCRLDAVNGSGCAGIGQACPGSKMGCSLTDAPCQLAYFESYALGRYGSWEAAYQFWLSHGWW